MTRRINSDYSQATTQSERRPTIEELQERVAREERAEREKLKQARRESKSQKPEEKRIQTATISRPVVKPVQVTKPATTAQQRTNNFSEEIQKLSIIQSKKNQELGLMRLL